MEDLVFKPPGNDFVTITKYSSPFFCIEGQALTVSLYASSKHLLLLVTALVSKSVFLVSANLYLALM
jgi:hypothetical protein